jgi:hypothetical protein
MSAAEPKTLPEWKAYTETLSGEPLFAAARAANTVSFVQTLQEEGYSAPEVHTIMVLFAKRFSAVGERPPGAGFYDYAKLAEEPLPVPV